MAKKMGRPKSGYGKLTTCTFELSVTQKRYIVRRAKSCGVSSSEIVRVLVNSAITAERTLIDAAPSTPPLQKEPATR